MNAAARRKALAPLEIGGATIYPGEVREVEIKLPPTFSTDNLSMDVKVVRGFRPGPTIFLCAAIHGDEINGIEIVRRVIKAVDPRKLSGTLLAIPIVNLYGFNTHSRYLPDGRDLNRSFPGSAQGSLTARLADTFMQEIVSKCTHGIDLHTGGRHRSNFPQIRAQLDVPEVREMTNAFGAPLVINSKERDGSLRQCATAMGVPVILYESCEALRFDEVYIRAGEKGVLDVMRHLGMLRKSRSKKAKTAPMISQETRWVRAPASGIHRVLVPLGAQVDRGQVLGVVADPMGDDEIEVKAPVSGILIGRSNLPLVYAGDALFHIARVRAKDFEFEEYHEELLPSDYDHPEDDPSSAPIAQ